MAFTVLMTMAALAAVFTTAAAAAQGSTYYFPQVADGNIGDLYFTTEFNIYNTISWPVLITVDFISDNGAPWAVSIQSADRPEVNGVQEAFRITLQGFETFHFFTGHSGPLTVGWAALGSEWPVVASAGFSFIDANGPRVLWAAGVLPAPASTRTFFNTNVSSRDHAPGFPGVDMGYAVANPGGTAAQITVTLTVREGMPWTGFLRTKKITVPPGGHCSQFLSELFNDVAWPEYCHGMVSFESDVNVAVLALKRTAMGGNTVYSTLAAVSGSDIARNITYDREDNNSFAYAQLLVAPTEVIGTSCRPDGSGDSDYFGILLQAGETVYVSVVAGMIGSFLDDTLTLYDPSHNQVGFVDDKFALDPMIAYTVPPIGAGTYYIERNSTGGTSGPYSFYRLLVRVY